ncbi:hypothetical protein QJQ45_020714 [Haematococcus lacustris]|nr:hypothetical protein QJQ45_020714 [Haematococcus lacustris]
MAEDSLPPTLDKPSLLRNTSQKDSNQAERQARSAPRPSHDFTPGRHPAQEPAVLQASPQHPEAAEVPQPDSQPAKELGVQGPTPQQAEPSGPQSSDPQPTEQMQLSPDTQQANQVPADDASSTQQTGARNPMSTLRVQLPPLVIEPNPPEAPPHLPGQPPPAPVQCTSPTRLSTLLNRSQPRRSPAGPAPPRVSLLAHDLATSRGSRLQHSTGPLSVTHTAQSSPGHFTSSPVQHPSPAATGVSDTGEGLDASSRTPLSPASLPQADLDSTDPRAARSQWLAVSRSASRAASNRSHAASLGGSFANVVMRSLKRLATPSTSGSQFGVEGGPRLLQRMHLSLRASFAGGLRPFLIEEPDERGTTGRSTAGANSLKAIFNKEASSALVVAVKAGDYAAAGEAIRLGADANTVDLPTGRMTPLHFAVSAGRVHTHDPPAFSGSTAAQLTRLLLRYGARAGAGDYMGFTPLHLAAFHNLPGVLDLLLGNLQQQPGRLASLLLLQDSEIKYTPLHCAVEGHHASAVVSLLQAGAAAGLDAKDWTSRTAWNLAAVHYPKFAATLMADLNIALARSSELPAGAVMQLALELRTLHTVPVVLRAAAKWPDQVWQLMRAAIASGLVEFVEMLATDIPAVSGGSGFPVAYTCQCSAAWYAAEFVDQQGAGGITVCPRALLVVPWGDVMVDLATRFPDCFKLLIAGLDLVDFHTVVEPFIHGLNFDDEDEEAEEVPSKEHPAHPNSPARVGGGEHSMFAPSMSRPGLAGERGSAQLQGWGLHPERNSVNATSFKKVAYGLSSLGRAVSRSLARRPRSVAAEEAWPSPDSPHLSPGRAWAKSRTGPKAWDLDQSSSRRRAGMDPELGTGRPGAGDDDVLSAQARVKSMMSLKSMLVLGKRDEVPAPGDPVGTKNAAHGLPESLKYLLLRALVASLDGLSWRVWQALVSGLHGSLALELARFPKLFKRLTDSIQNRKVPSWIEDLNHLVSAAIASRTGANVYNIILAMSGWLALNPTCYLAHLDAWALTALAQHYPDACRRLLSLQSQDQNAVKVPGHLLPARTGDSSSSMAVFRCADQSQSFIWQEDGLVVMRALGINDMARIERWSLFGVSFDATLKLFKATTDRHPSRLTASYLDKLLAAGLSGQDVTKLIQLDTDLADVIAGLRGGLSAHFVHHMLHRKISYQVVTEMLGAHLDRSTQWNNIRHQEIWHRFPRDSWERGITYEFIRLFFENWEDYSFDHRFVDLMFDSHDPLFVKLRTALEYVNSNKALNVSLRQDEADIQQARQARLISSWTAVGDAYMEATTHVHRRVLTGLVYCIMHVYIWLLKELSPVFTEGTSTSSSQHIPRKPTNHPPHGSSRHTAPKRTPVGKQLIESPKVDALSETLPMIYVAQVGKDDYLRALLAAQAPAEMFGLPVMEAIINVKWNAYGWRMLLLLLMEHLLFMAFVIAYLMLITTEASACFGSLNQDDNTTTSDTPSLQPDGPTLAPPLAPSPPSARQTMSVPHISLLAQCPQGAASLCLDACLLWMCALALSSYIRQLQHTGLYFWLRKPNNWADLVTCALQASITVSHVSGRQDALLAMTSVQVLLQFLRLGWYAMLVDRLGSLVRVISQIFQASPSAHDTLFFLLLLVLLYIGFVLALLVLAPPPGSVSSDGSDLLSGGQLALKLFTIALGDIDMPFLRDVILKTFATPWLSFLLTVAYTVMLLIVAFNMLVGIMADTFNRIRSAERHEILQAKAAVLVEIESSLNDDTLNSIFTKLLGRYLHVLQPTQMSAAHGYMQDPLRDTSCHQVASMSQLGGSFGPSRAGSVRNTSVLGTTSQANASLPGANLPSALSPASVSRRMSRTGTSFQSRATGSGAISVSGSVRPASALSSASRPAMRPRSAFRVAPLEGLPPSLAAATPPSWKMGDGRLSRRPTHSIMRKPSLRSLSQLVNPTDPPSTLTKRPTVLWNPQLQAEPEEHGVPLSAAALAAHQAPDRVGATQPMVSTGLPRLSYAGSIKSRESQRLPRPDSAPSSRKVLSSRSSFGNQEMATALSKRSAMGIKHQLSIRNLDGSDQEGSQPSSPSSSALMMTAISHKPRLSLRGSGRIQRAGSSSEDDNKLHGSSWAPSTAPSRRTSARSQRHPFALRTQPSVQATLQPASVLLQKRLSYAGGGILTPAEALQVEHNVLVLEEDDTNTEDDDDDIVSDSNSWSGSEHGGLGAPSAFEERKQECNAIIPIMHVP